MFTKQEERQNGWIPSDTSDRGGPRAEESGVGVGEQAVYGPPPQ